MKPLSPTYRGGPIRPWRRSTNRVILLRKLPCHAYRRNGVNLEHRHREIWFLSAFGNELAQAVGDLAEG